MAKVYELVVVKDGKETVVPESNQSSQIIQEAKWDLMHGRMTANAEEVAKYNLTATNPTALLKGKNK